LNNQKKDRNRGVSLVETALLVTLIAVVCIASVRIFGQKVACKYVNAASDGDVNKRGNLPLQIGRVRCFPAAAAT